MLYKWSIKKTVGFPGAVGCSCTCQCRRHEFNPWAGKIPWRRKWQSTPVFLPGKFHGQRSLEGYSPWSQKESDKTEWLTLSFSIKEMSQLYLIKASILLNGFSRCPVVKNLPANAGGAWGHKFNRWVGKIPWRRKWELTPLFLPGKFHGQRSLAGYRP